MHDSWQQQFHIIHHDNTHLKQRIESNASQNKADGPQPSQLHRIDHRFPLRDLQPAIHDTQLVAVVADVGADAVVAAEARNREVGRHFERVAAALEDAHVGQ